MEAQQVVRRRLRSVRLTGPGLASPPDVVRHLVAVQSQDFLPARWSVGDRLRRGTDAAVADAFDRGELLRTHVLRPTWHFVLPDDIRWLIELTGPRVQRFMATYDKRLELDGEVYRKSDRLITKALAGGQHLTRAELKAVLAGAHIEADTQRLAHLVMHAELGGLICSGPTRGKQHTYALLEQRAPHARTLSRDEAVAELVLRYFTRHGPATVKDCHWWSSLTQADIRTGLEAVGDRLVREEVEGVAFWYDATVARARLVSPAVHLVHGYDEYVVGYTESKPLLLPTGARYTVPIGQVSFNSLVLLDGQVAGVWRRVPGKDSLVVEVRLNTTLDTAETAALEHAVRRYERFAGRPVELRVR